MYTPALRFAIEYISSCMTAFKEDTSSAKGLGLQLKLSGRWLINIRNSRGPRIDPSGTPDFIDFQEEVTLLNITIRFLSGRELFKTTRINS